VHTLVKAAFNAEKPQDSLATFSYNINRPYQDITHELIKAKVHYHIATRWKAYVQYAYQYNMRKEYDKDKPLNNVLAAQNKPELDYRIQTHTVDFVLEHLTIKSFRGQFGGSFMNQKNVYLGRFFVPNFINNTWGVFASERYVRQHIEVEAGVRYDQKNLKSYYYKGNDLQSPVLDFNNVSWNVGTIIKPTTKLNFFVNVGSAWRAPAPNELYVNGIHHGVGSIERGKEDLKTEQVYNITFTGLYLVKKYRVEVTAYHNQFSNFIYLNPGTQPELTIKGAYPVFDYKQANARISGLDAKLSSEFFNHLQLTAKAMLLRAWNTTSNDYLVYMPSDRYTLDAKLFTNFKNTNELYVQVGYQFITKQWRVPANTDFAPPPKQYGLLSAEIGTSIKVKRTVCNISLAASNLLNTEYRDYLDRFRYFANSQGTNYILRLNIPLTLYDKK
jgi:iron complex outermembrane recepter protein